MHGIFYDHVHDEIVVPVALGGAILTLPGDAASDAPPKRILQGPKTGISQPDTVFVDLEHDELIVESGDDAVLVFPRTAQGDVAPSRRIGGPNSGVFLQITCDDAADLLVPGQKYTFGTVKAAQARGDFEVLAERGRRALRVHLGAEVNRGLAILEFAIRTALM